MDQDKVEGNPSQGNGISTCLQVGIHMSCLKDRELTTSCRRFLGSDNNDSKAAHHVGCVPGPGTLLIFYIYFSCQLEDSAK